MLRGAYDVLEGLEKRLGIKNGESNEKFPHRRGRMHRPRATALLPSCAGTEYFLNVGMSTSSTTCIAQLEKNPHPESEVV